MIQPPYAFTREQLIEGLVNRGYRRDYVEAFVNQHYPDGVVVVVKYVLPKEAQQ